MSGFKLSSPRAVAECVSRLDREEIRLVGVCVCVLKTGVSRRAQCGDDRGDETYSRRRIHGRSWEPLPGRKLLS